MNAPLSDVPQFIITSITFLITSTQAGYLVRLDEIFYKRLGDQGTISRESIYTWRSLLVAWWVLTSSALLGSVRILLNYLFSWESYVFDCVILGDMTLGYLLLCYVALRSWRWSSWGGRSLPH